jgi:alpha-tubulin suppressor-like RCC1 family protein
LVTLVGWGTNSAGTVGDGTMNIRCAPVLATSARGSLTGTLFTIASGHATNYVVGENGLIYAWGQNWYGQRK